MTTQPSSDQVLIRDAREDEMDLVRELFREYAGSLNFNLSFQNFEEELATLPGNYRPPSGRLLVAFCGTMPAGCVGLRQFDQHRCEMKRLYVRPSYRGRRIGELLVDRLMEEARSIGGYQSVLLDTIQPLMSRAITLYKKMGFREIPAYRANPMRGAVYMECKL
jgi:putative acetyltransferase